MKKTVFAAALAAAMCAGAQEVEKVAIKIVLPEPKIVGTPKELKDKSNLEPDPGVGKLRPPIMVPKGYDKLLSYEKPATASDELVNGELEYLTDGDKERDPTSMVQLPGGLQWVQSCELAHSGNLLVDHGVVLHRAGA